jgi:hypothetical protein
MRTVHETEALRPSDPIPKSMQPSAKTSSRRLKLILKASQISPDELSGEAENSNVNGDASMDWSSSYPAELGFTSDEEGRGPEQLYKYLRRELIWIEEESEQLKRQADELETIRKREWMEKEVLLDQAVTNELSYYERRTAVLEGQARLPTAEEIKAAAAVAGSASSFEPVQEPKDELLSQYAPVPTQMAFVKTQPLEDQTEAAAVLASMRQTS